MNSNGNGRGAAKAALVNGSRVSIPSGMDAHTPVKTQRIVGYARVSTIGQAVEGISLAEQHHRISQYAAAHGFELVGVEISPRSCPAKTSASSCIC